MRCAKRRKENLMKLSHGKRRTAVWTGALGAAALATLTAQLTPVTRSNASDHIDSPDGRP
jgi:hypothetical protein